MNNFKISIIIATRNRQSILWPSVDKAIAAIEGMLVEIIIINDGDQPLNIPPSLQHNINCYDNPSRGVSAARNYGVLKSSGSILFFVDDDMWINKKAIHWVVNYMSNAQNHFAVYNLNWEYPPELNNKLTHAKVGRFILQSNYNTMWGRMHEQGLQPSSGLYLFDTIGSCSLVMHQQIFRTLQGYNESLIFQGEDVDLSFRINKYSIPIYCVFDTTLHHNHEDRLELGTYLERIKYGYQAQFLAEKTGYIAPSVFEFNNWTILVFEFFRKSEKGWIGLYNLIPNRKFFDACTNRLTGLLSGLQRYKQWRQIFGKVE